MSTVIPLCREDLPFYYSRNLPAVQSLHVASKAVVDRDAIRRKSTRNAFWIDPTG